MKRVFTCLLVVLVFGAASVFAGGQKDASAETTTTTVAPVAADGSYMSWRSNAAEGEEHTRIYSVSEWERISGQPLQLSEAPMLAAMVQRGELPPLEQRLPNREDIQVVQPSEAVGTYGGLWRRANLGVLSLQVYTETDEQLFTMDYWLNETIPNLAKDYELSNNNRTLTIYLRKGMKWSDGHPFTADDFEYYWNDVLLNSELTPAVPGVWKSGGEVAQFTRIDDYTISWTFKEPYGMVLTRLTVAYPPKPFMPAHYLKQFHPAYTSASELQRKVSDAGFQTWPELMRAMWGTNGENPDRPVLGAFILLDKKGSPVARLRRNPYYFKVDIAGQQLPYIDDVQETLMGDAEGILLRTLAGDIDIQGLRIAGTANLPVLSENAERGDYRIVHYPGPEGNLSPLFFNFFHEDEVLRNLFLNKDFRIALSHGIDREEISDLNYAGLAEPSQVSTSPKMDIYIDEYATRYTEYDPDRANQILDSLGLRWDARREWRLRSDGKRLQIEIKAFTPWPAENVANCELIAQYWKNLGIEVVVRPTDRATWQTQVEASDFMVAAYSAHFGFPSYPPIGASALFPAGLASYQWVQWSVWIETNGERGVEPPADVKRLAEIKAQIPALADDARVNALYQEAFKIHDDNFWMIGIVREPNIGRYFIYKNKVGNTTEFGFANWRIADYKFPYAWATYYYKY